MTTLKKSEVYAFIAQDMNKKRSTLLAEQQELVTEAKTLVRKDIEKQLEKELGKDLKVFQDQVFGKLDELANAAMNVNSVYENGYSELRDLQNFKEIVTNMTKVHDYAVGQLPYKDWYIDDTSYHVKKLVPYKDLLKDIIDKGKSIKEKLKDVVNLEHTLTTVVKRERTGEKGYKALVELGYDIELDALEDIEKKNELVDLEKTKQLIKQMKSIGVEDDDINEG